MPNQDSIRAGYQGALQIYTDERDNIWSVSNSLLLANSVFLLAMTSGFPGSNHTLHGLFASFLAFAGIVICVAWLGLISRGYKYMDFYIASARGFEGTLLGKQSTLKVGESLAQGDKVEADGQGFQMRPCRLESIRNRCFVYSTVGVFVAAYCVLAAMAWLA